MKLFNGWEIYIRYNGDPLLDMYAKRLTIFLFKDKPYVETEEKENQTYVALSQDTTTSTGGKL